MNSRCPGRLREPEDYANELVFELWQDGRGSHSVHVAAAMQTLGQMRTAQDSSLVSPPAREELAMPGCKAGTSACGWTDFRRMAERAIDKDDVLSTEPH